MAQFTDAKKRLWSIEINVAAVKRVRSLTGMDLLSVFGGDLLEKLYGDPVALCDVLYALCKPQADSQSVTDEQFGEGLAGQSIAHATRALLDELVNFSRSPKEQENLRAVLETMERKIDAAIDLASIKIKSGEVERAMDLALEKYGEKSIAVPASSD